MPPAKLPDSSASRYMFSKACVVILLDTRKIIMRPEITCLA